MKKFTKEQIDHAISAFATFVRDANEEGHAGDCGNAGVFLVKCAEAADQSGYLEDAWREYVEIASEGSSLNCLHHNIDSLLCVCLDCGFSPDKKASELK